MNKQTKPRNLALEIAQGLNTQQQRPTCPNCGWSSTVAHRTSSETFVCRHCGHIWTHKDVVSKSVRNQDNKHGE